MTDFEQQVAALEQTRRAILIELEASFNPRFWELKRKSLAFVDAKLAALRGGVGK